MEEECLLIKISHFNNNDNLSLRCTASANLALGMIARARHELDAIERKIYADLAKPKKES